MEHQTTIVADFAKADADEDRQFIFGWANVSRRVDGDDIVDHHGDIIPPEVLEDAAYGFVLNFGATGDMHQGDPVGTMIESVMFTAEKRTAMGLPDGSVPDGWWVGFHIPDPDVFAKVKNGERPMLSIQGQAIVDEIEVDD